MEMQAIAKIQEGYTRMSSKELLKIVKENRSKHVEEFGQAHKGWRTEYSKSLAALSEKMAIYATNLHEGVVEGNPFDVYSATTELPSAPKSYKKSYDRMIRKLELSKDEDYFISHADFEKYVLDEWSWKGHHTEAVNRYSNVVGG